MGHNLKGTTLEPLGIVYLGHLGGSICCHLQGSAANSSKTPCEHISEPEKPQKEGSHKHRSLTPLTPCGVTFSEQWMDCRDGFLVNAVPKCPCTSLVYTWPNLKGSHILNFGAYMYLLYRYFDPLGVSQCRQHSYQKATRHLKALLHVCGILLTAYKRLSVCRAPEGHLNIGILQTITFGILLILGPGTRM